MPTTTKYIWDDDNYLAEADGSDAITVVYTNEPQQHGKLVSTRISGATSYHHFDAIGSTRQLTNSSAKVTDIWIYDAWGNIEFRTGSTNALLSWLGAFGYYFDAELITFYVRWRAYSPISGRWTSVDPLQYAIALYVYGYNSPMRFYDFLGLDACEESAKCPVTPKDPPGGNSVAGTIKCQDGELVVVVGPPIIKLDSPCATECVKLHEQKHIEQYDCLCPAFCQCAKNDGKSPVPNDMKLKNNFECIATNLELSCLLEAHKDITSPRPTRNDCFPTDLVGRIRTQLRYLKANGCDPYPLDTGTKMPGSIITDPAMKGLYTDKPTAIKGPAFGK